MKTLILDRSLVVAETEKDGEQEYILSGGILLHPQRGGLLTLLSELTVLNKVDTAIIEVKFGRALIQIEKSLIHGTEVDQGGVLFLLNAGFLVGLHRPSGTLAIISPTFNQTVH